MDLDDFLSKSERATNIQLDANRKMMDNHLDESDRVIANIAALSNLTNDDLLRLALTGNPL